MAVCMLLWILLMALTAWAIVLHCLLEPDSPNLQRLCDELLTAARARYPSDERITTAQDVITRVGADSTEGMVNYARKTVRRGKFDRATGTLLIGTVHRNGRPLHPTIVRGVLVHEVAHAGLPDGKHSEEWRDLYLKLLKVATEDLRWEIQLECSSCKFYGMCGSEDCPKCTWKACKRRLRA